MPEQVPSFKSIDSAASRFGTARPWQDRDADGRSRARPGARDAHFPDLIAEFF